MAINTSGLTGYAKEYAEARNAGKSDTAAHAAATSKTGTAGSGRGMAFASFEGSSDSNPLGYEVTPNTSAGYSLTGIVPKYEDYTGGYTSLIPDVPKATLPELPVYQPYQPKEFQYTAPNYSITSDPSKTSFIPTTRARDRWLQQEQLNADNAYKGYGSQFNAYTQAYKEQQDALVNALKQKELEQRTIAEQVEAALRAAESKTKAENAAWEKDFEERKLAADMAYKNASLAARGSGGSSGSSPKAPTTAELGSGYQNYAKEKLSVYAYTPENAKVAADMAIQQLNLDMPDLGITASQYADIVKQIYLSVGINPSE